MSTVLVEVSNAVPNWHEKFLAHVLPTVQSVASFRFRGLPPVDLEEAISEVVALAMIVFVRLMERGKDPQTFPSRLARYAVLRVKAGRIAGAQDRSRDAMSRLAHRQRGFGVESLDAADRQNGDGWESVLVENWTITPADLAASRIDFREWLGRMKRRRREIAESLAAGYRTEEVAELFRLSRGRVSQMRREFENSWRKYQEDAPSRPEKEKPAGSAAA